MRINIRFEYMKLCIRIELLIHAEQNPKVSIVMMVGME